MKEDLLKNEQTKYKPGEDELNKYELLIDDYYKYIKVEKIIALISFLIFLVLFTISTSTKTPGNWFYIFLPLEISVISTSLFLNHILRIQQTIENYENRGMSVGTIISYFCLNISAVNMLIYLILFSLRLQESINSNYLIISVPIFLIFGTGIFYFIFLIPALLESKLYIEVFLVISYIVNGFAFLIVINNNFDTNAQNKFSVMLIPIWIALSFHIIFNTYCVIKGEFVTNYLISYSVLSVLLIDAILLCVKYDRQVAIPNWVLGLLIIFAFHIFAIEKMYYSFLKQEDIVEEKGDISNKI